MKKCSPKSIALLRIDALTFSINVCKRRVLSPLTAPELAFALLPLLECTLMALSELLLLPLDNSGSS